MRRVLIAEDVRSSRELLASLLTRMEYDVTATADGAQAWDALCRPDAPRLAVIDWKMPGLSGLQLTRRLRAERPDEQLYIILLTGRDGIEDITQGLDAGANDFLSKPYHPEELTARLQVGFRYLELQDRVAERVRELERALGEVKRLQGLLPVCAWCRKVRDGNDYWRQIEDYLSEHAGYQFTHAMCPDCYQRVSAPEGPRPPESLP